MVDYTPGAQVDTTLHIVNVYGETIARFNTVDEVIEYTEKYILRGQEWEIYAVTQIQVGSVMRMMDGKPVYSLRGI